MSNFTEGNIPKQLLKFSAPIILGEFLNSLYIIVDAFWVGRLIGKDALGAVSGAFPVIFTLYALIFGLGVATQVLVARSFGKGHKDGTSGVIYNSLISMSVLCVILTVAGIISVRPILSFINTPAEIFEMSRLYLTIILAGMFSRAAYDWLSGVLKGSGNSVTPFIILSTAVVLNTAITPVLIKGIGPLRAMGIAGSAAGTIVSYTAAVILGWVIFIRPKKLFPAIFPLRKPDGVMTRSLFSIGIPYSLQVMVKGVSWLGLTAIVNLFGPAAIAAYGIGVRVDMLAFLTAFAVSMAVASMTSQNLGAARTDRIHSILTTATRLTLFYSLFWFGIVNIFPGQIASFFTSNQSVMAFTHSYFRIASWGYIILAFSFSFQGVLVGSGKTKILMLFTLISMVVLRIPLAYLLSLSSRLGANGIWIAIPLTAGTMLGFTWLYYRKFFSKGLALEKY